MPASNVVTPLFRAGFISVFRPSKPRTADAEQEAKYSVRACFPPDTDLSALKAEAKEAINSKWPTGAPKNPKSPFRRNDELDTPIPGIGDDWIVMTFSAKPGQFSAANNLVDVDCNPILDETEIYSGAWFIAQVRPYAFEKNGNKGAAFGLQNLQKRKDDEPLGSPRQNAASAFGAPGGGSKKSADDIW